MGMDTGAEATGRQPPSAAMKVMVRLEGGTTFMEIILRLERQDTQGARGTHAGGVRIRRKREAKP
jgi:hypothetical protein